MQVGLDQGHDTIISDLVDAVAVIRHKEDKGLIGGIVVPVKLGPYEERYVLSFRMGLEDRLKLVFGLEQVSVLTVKEPATRTCTLLVGLDLDDLDKVVLAESSGTE